MRQTELNQKIRGFMARKEQEFPELSLPVGVLSRELGIREHEEKAEMPRAHLVGHHQRAHNLRSLFSS